MPIVLVGIALRLLLMPFTIQGDILLNSWITHFIVLGHWNVYSYYFQQYGTIYYPPNGPVDQRIEATAFLPLFYVIDACYLRLLEALNVLPFVSEWGIRLAFPFQYRDYFFFKLLYIPFDFISLASLIKVVDPIKRRTVAALWFLSPVLLYIGYMWGQIDLLVAMSFCLGLYYANKSLASTSFRCAVVSELFLGFGAAIKILPILLVPVVAGFLGRRRLVDVCALLSAGLLVPVLTIIPFLSKPFLESMFSQSNPYRYPIYVFLVGYLTLVLYAFLVERTLTFDRLVFYGLAVNALFFALTSFLPQFFLWALPFLVLTASRDRRAFAVYVVILISYFVISQSFGNSLMIGLFSPLNSRLAGFPSLSHLLPDFGLFLGVARGLFGAGLFFMCYLQLQPQRVDFRTSLGRALATLLIPVGFGVLNLLLGHDYLREQGTLLIPGFTAAIKSDLPLFVPYIIVTAATMVAMAVALRRPSYERTVSA